MRGADTFTESPFMLHRLEDFVPSDHPLRAIRQMVNEALGKMDGLFAGMYEPHSQGGRPSIAPEKLLRAMLLQVFYSIRSERQLMEQVQYNLLYRWFIGLAMDDAVWVPTVFTKNRERLLAHDAVIELFQSCGAKRRRARLALGRALQRGRHAYPGVGEPQELCAQGRQRRRPGRRQLQGSKPFKRNARIKH